MYKKKVNIVGLEGSISIKISKKVEQQIKYLCNQINNVEWSGILFYSTKGVFNTKSFKIRLEYIYPMDKGTGGSTGFNYDEEVVEFMMTHPESLEWKQGLIHSHNKMTAYFSGIDMDEIAENAENHNYYLSIVVNNRFDIVGRIAFHASLAQKKVTYVFRGDNGVEKRLTLSGEKDNVVFYKNCKIFTSHESVSDEFKKRTQVIIHKAATRPNLAVYGTHYPVTGFNPHRPGMSRTDTLPPKNDDEGYFDGDNINYGKLSKEQIEFLDNWFIYFVTEGKDKKGETDLDSMFEQFDDFYEGNYKLDNPNMKRISNKFDDLYSHYFGKNSNFSKLFALKYIQEELMLYIGSSAAAEELMGYLEDMESNPEFIKKLHFNYNN